MLACANGSATLVDLLVQNGATIQLQDDKGQKAEDFAIVTNHSSLLDHLAAYDIDIDIDMLRRATPRPTCTRTRTRTSRLFFTTQRRELQPRDHEAVARSRLRRHVHSARQRWPRRACGRRDGDSDGDGEGLLRRARQSAGAREREPESACAEGARRRRRLVGREPRPRRGPGAHESLERCDATTRSATQVFSFLKVFPSSRSFLCSFRSLSSSSSSLRCVYCSNEIDKSAICRIRIRAHK